jgi:hypothetical protein
LEKNNKNWSKNYNNKNWNKNWLEQELEQPRLCPRLESTALLREFVGGGVLGSILAATCVGIVPYAPEPNLCWYWADPYMYRGYWDYCYEAQLICARQASGAGLVRRLCFSLTLLDYSAGRAAQRRMRVNKLRFRK